MSAHATGRASLPSGEAGLGDALTPLEARGFALGAWPYHPYCPARRALAPFASDAPVT